MSACLALVLVGSCDPLRQARDAPGGVTPPEVTFLDATLVQAPSERMAAAYYCPRVVPDPYGVPGAAEQLCSRVLGASPSLEAMRVAFDLRFRVHNPTDLPMPLAEILTAVTVMPGSGEQELGAVCVKLCSDGEACTGAPDPSSCRDSPRDIRSLEDFGDAAADLLVSSGLALAAGEQPTFAAPELAAAGDLTAVVRFSFAPPELLEILERTAERAVESLKAGGSVDFRIPYSVEGTIWFDAGSLGRVAVGYGPERGEWEIPTEALRLY